MKVDTHPLHTIRRDPEDIARFCRLVQRLEWVHRHTGLSYRQIIGALFRREAGHSHEYADRGAGTCADYNQAWEA